MRRVYASTQRRHFVLQSLKARQAILIQRNVAEVEGVIVSHLQPGNSGHKPAAQHHEAPGQRTATAATAGLIATCQPADVPGGWVGMGSSTMATERRKPDSVPPRASLTRANAKTDDHPWHRPAPGGAHVAPNPRI